MSDENKKVTPLKAIKEFCKHNCCVGDQKSWKYCQAVDCTLHPFRFGKNPFRKRKMTEEQKQAAAERMRKAREAKDNE
jgi:hypothetical protein